uniref:inositol polyphosphate 5-phosphatase K-like n=1 Tax=Styela clava TaxID=7725 RepID=UPI001939992B|nr:inositol polyphosphate 5-phosphatase K-like [Styela clava]
MFNLSRQKLKEQELLVHGETKGGVAVSCNIYGQKVCFLNVHLSAHLNNDDARIDDINEIMKEMEFGGNATVQSHDLILMFGDMNFRIDHFSREEILNHVAEKNYSVLWDKDQLKKHKKVHDLLAEFEEGTLDFDPTYKYDPGTDTYDTSEKKRKPAWTDRILWRVHPEIRTSAPPFTISLIDESFKNHKTFQQSDHKPVTGEFEFKIVDIPFLEPLLRIEQQGDWMTDRNGEYTVELYGGMRWNSKDYVGLYKHPLQDFRSYQTYMYLPDLRKRNSSSSSSSSDDEQLVQRSPQDVSTETNDRVKHLTFKKSQITERGMFVLGYFSYNMQCLVAVTKPFQVR